MSTSTSAKRRYDRREEMRRDRKAWRAYAASALAGFLGNPENLGNNEQSASWAADHADAMLAEEKKRFEERCCGSEPQARAVAEDGGAGVSTLDGTPVGG